MIETGMYKLIIETDFSAAHKLRHYRGKCEQLHGHNWIVKVALIKESLNATGMVIDFHKGEKIIHKVIDTLDHKYLNELGGFKKINPTTENLCRLLYEQLTPLFKKRGVQVESIGVWESPECGAYYYPDKNGAI